MRKPQRRWVAIALVAGGLLALLSQVEFAPASTQVREAPSSPSQGAAPVAVIAEPSGDDPTPGSSETSPLPSGGLVASVLDDRSANGATASALYFLELSEDLVHMDPEGAGAVQASLATTDRATETAAEVESQVRALADSVGPGFSLEVAAIKWAVVETSPDEEYQISIWYLEVFDQGSGGDVVASYKTYSASLRWENGWKLADSSVIAGPTPGPLGEPTRGTDLASRLGGFHDGGDLGPCCPTSDEN